MNIDYRIYTCIYYIYMTIDLLYMYLFLLAEAAFGPGAPLVAEPSAATRSRQINDLGSGTRGKRKASSKANPFTKKKSSTAVRSMLMPLLSLAVDSRWTAFVWREKKFATATAMH